MSSGDNVDIVSFLLLATLFFVAGIVFFLVSFFVSFCVSFTMLSLMRYALQSLR